MKQYVNNYRAPAVYVAIYMGAFYRHCRAIISTTGLGGESAQSVYAQAVEAHWNGT